MGRRIEEKIIKQESNSQGYHLINAELSSMSIFEVTSPLSESKGI